MNKFCQVSDTHPLCTDTSCQWQSAWEDPAEYSQHPACPPCPPRLSLPPLGQEEQWQGAGALVLGLAQALVQPPFAA